MNIEIEEFKDDAEYFNQMKIRASAGELPDLMYLQTRYYPGVQGLYGGPERHARPRRTTLLAGWMYQRTGRIIGVPEKLAADYVLLLGRRV